MNRMRTSLGLPVLACLMAGLPLPAGAEDVAAPTSMGGRDAAPATMAVPTQNPARLAAADERTVEASATRAATPAMSGPDVEIARALRSRLDAAAPRSLSLEPGQDKIHADAEEEILAEEHAAIGRFYAARQDAPVWVTSAGATDKARNLLAALAEAPAYGLDTDLIPSPRIDASGAVILGAATAALNVPLPVAKSEAVRQSGADAVAETTPRDRDDAHQAEAMAAAELAFTRAALVYARHARGGRVLKPADMLNSNLDRKPQLISPIVVLADLAVADDMSAALAKLHPVHPQFEKLRRAFLTETGGNGQGALSAKAKRLRANMEFWRWMWDDLGELYIFNNIPEFMQTVVRKGEVVRHEKIVVGEIGKQSSVFSRPLKEVVLRPRWRVPESIMVHELWPSLRKGGGLMRQHGLEITTKSGEPRDWRQIDWSQEDIRNYHVWQSAGGKSALGFVKFSFPSQHTIFMHDTPDKWMFNRGQRTLSHGCLRLKNPMELTEIVLDHDRGWDRAKIKDLIASGPLDNNIEMQRHIPVHLAYFTAWADDDGKVRFFRDIYGHEKRVTQALDGDWRKINKGRNHLAKPVPSFGNDAVAVGAPVATPRKGKKQESVADMIADALGL